MHLLHIAIERLDVEAELPKVGRLELLDLQLEGDETLQTSVEENEVDGEVLIADLHRVLRADEAEVPAQLREEPAEMAEQGAMEVGL